MPILKLPAVITLTFDGRTVQLNPDENERYNLNVLWKAAGSLNNKRPAQWLRTQSTIDFIEKISNVQKCTIESRRGSAANGGGTWAVREIVFSYAEWISADFHKAVIDTFSAAVDGNGDKAVAIARSAARVDGVASRKAFASGLAKHGADKTFYADMSDTVNIIVLGKSSSSMKEELGIKAYKSLRDHLPDTTLLALGAVEALAAARLAFSTDPRKAVAREITYESANDVAQLLGIK